MKKVDMISEIREWAIEMQPYVILCKLRESILELPKEPEQFSVELFREAYKWFKILYHDFFLPLRDVRELQSEEQWDRLELWGGFDDDEEVVLWRLGRKEFRKYINSDRPLIIKKGWIKQWRRQRRQLEKSSAA